MWLTCAHTNAAIGERRSGFRKECPYTRLTSHMAQCRRVRILLVEDEANLREGIVDLLEADSHAVTAVADGVTGVETGLRELFDLVVLDLMLPRSEERRVGKECMYR